MSRRVIPSSLTRNSVAQTTNSICNAFPYFDPLIITITKQLQPPKRPSKPQCPQFPTQRTIPTYRSSLPHPRTLAPSASDSNSQWFRSRSHQLLQLLTTHQPSDLNSSPFRFRSQQRLQSPRTHQPSDMPSGRPLMPPFRYRRSSPKRKWKDQQA